MQNTNQNYNKYINPALIKGTIKQSRKFLIIFLSVILGFTFLALLLYMAIRNIKDPAIGVISNMDILQYYISDSHSDSLLMGLIFTGIVAMAALLKDERKNTTEFLFAHPISRKKMFFTQMISFVSILFIFSFIIMAGSFLFLIIFNRFKIDFDVGQYFVFHAGLFLTNILYGFFMYGLASVMKGKNYLAPAICIGVGMYLLYYLFIILAAALQSIAPWVQKLDCLFVINILKVDTFSGVTKGYMTFRWQPILVWSLLAIALNVWGYFRYQKKDLNCA
ncbi:MAG TPA: ABC transporter permease [Clostridia bacterium]